MTPAFCGGSSDVRRQPCRRKSPFGGVRSYGFLSHPLRVQRANTRRLAAPMPTRPMPNSASVPGSGAALGSVTMARKETFCATVMPLLSPFTASTLCTAKVPLSWSGSGLRASPVLKVSTIEQLSPGESTFEAMTPPLLLKISGQELPHDGVGVRKIETRLFPAISETRYQLQISGNLLLSLKNAGASKFLQRQDGVRDPNHF